MKYNGGNKKRWLARDAAAFEEDLGNKERERKGGWLTRVVIGGLLLRRKIVVAQDRSEKRVATKTLQHPRQTQRMFWPIAKIAQREVESIKLHLFICPLIYGIPSTYIFLFIFFQFLASCPPASLFTQHFPSSPEPIIHGIFFNSLNAIITHCQQFCRLRHPAQGTAPPLGPQCGQCGTLAAPAAAVAAVAAVATTLDSTSCGPVSQVSWCLGPSHRKRSEQKQSAAAWQEQSTLRVRS